MRSRLLVSLFGAVICCAPAFSQLEGERRAEALLETYTSAMESCDIAAFDNLHADNLAGRGPGGAPIDHIGLEEQCRSGSPDAVDYTMRDYEIADGLLIVYANLVLKEQDADGVAIETPFFLTLTSRLTANGDEQVVVSETRFPQR